MVYGSVFIFKTYIYSININEWHTQGCIAEVKRMITAILEIELERRSNKNFLKPCIFITFVKNHNVY